MVPKLGVALTLLCAVPSRGWRIAGWSNSVFEAEGFRSFVPVGQGAAAPC